MSSNGLENSGCDKLADAACALDSTNQPAKVGEEQQWTIALSLKADLCQDLNKLGNNSAVKKLDRKSIDAQIPQEHFGWRTFVELLNVQMYKR